MTSARDEILARLGKVQERRNIPLDEPDLISPIYHELEGSLDVIFRKNIELVSGKVIETDSLATAAGILKNLLKEKKQESLFCADPVLIEAFGDQLNIKSGETDFLNLNIGLTRCELLVAHLGSILISSAHSSGRRLNVFPETHIVLAFKEQIVDYLENAMEKLQEKYKNNLPSLISTITGPSRTADIEKTLVMGMHGPKDLIVILTEKSF